MQVIETQKLELHYFFIDDSHQIDAIVRHKCESELFAMISEIALKLNLDISVEVEPYADGGFIDRYKIIWNNLEVGTKIAIVSLGLSAFSICLTTILNRFPASNISPEMEQINMEIALRTRDRMRYEDGKRIYNDKFRKDSTKIYKQLTADAKKREIEREKEEEKKGSQDENNIVAQYIPNIPNMDKDITENVLEENFVQIFAKALSELETNPRINRFRSNFYKSLRQYPKVSKISTTPLNENNEPIQEPVTILSENFSQYIIESDELDPEIDDTG